MSSKASPKGIKGGDRVMTAKTSPTLECNLYLVGFMGTGKSTLGRLLASSLGFVFVDSDKEIERIRGKAVSEIFAEEGEEAFRRYEREFIEQGHPDRKCVVACGGGLVTQPGMVELLKARGVVVCLYASPGEIINRTRGNRTRPLLECEDPESRIRRLMAEREPLYRLAGSLVLTENRTRADVLAHIKRIYGQEARRRSSGRRS